MLSHLSLGISDLERSRTFYDAALAPLGYVRLWSEPGGLGYGAPRAGNERLALFLQRSASVALAAGPGFHLALVAPSRAAVEQFHAAAIAAGGRDAGAAAPRPGYSPTYYAAFVLDPDGHKLEAVHQ
jgi:catechol 2,3-dioxygenase-like lactoylglutathione lyase family enzyme